MSKGFLNLGAHIYHFYKGDPFLGVFSLAIVDCPYC